MKQAQHFSVVCNETTIMSVIRNNSACVFNYWMKKDAQHRIREEFLQFQTVINLTGEGLAAM